MSQPMRRVSLVLLLVFLLSCKSGFSQNQSSGGLFGVEESSTNQPLNPDKLFRDMRVGANTQPKLGGLESSFETQFRGPLLGIPLLSRAVRPEDAELRLGRFYLDVRAVSGSILYSDNIDWSGSDRESGVIGLTRLRLATLFQLTDDLRLTLAGTLVYLPFKNRGGIAGFQIIDNLAEFENATLAQAQITYDLDWGKWHTELFDEFRVRLERFANDYELFEGGDFNAEDRAGRYVYREQTSGREDRIGDALVETRNIIGFSMDRLLPTETRLEFGANHANYWYEGDDEGGLPTDRDLAYVSLVSERESTRFKPFLIYQAFQYSYDDATELNDDLNQQVDIGFKGPASDNLEILGQVGYFYGGHPDRDAVIGRARIGHNITPLTYQQFGFTRRVTQPDQDIEESWHYMLRRTLAPKTYGEIFGVKSQFDDLDGNQTSSDEWRAGVRLTFLGLMPETTLRLSGFYTDINYDSNEFTDLERWTAQAEMYRGSLEWRIIYNYQTRSTSPTAEGFYENLFVLTMTKYF